MKDGWEVKNLGKVCEYFNGVAHEHCIDNNGKYKLINSKFISSNGLNFKSSSQGLFLLKRGDITMCLSDVPNGKTLAKCFLVDKDETYTLNQRICVVRSTRMLEKFLYYQLNRNQHLLNFDNGENQTNLRLNQVLECPLYLPPTSEQQRIVAILDQAFEGIAKARANAEQNLQNARALFESHLQSVFTQRGDGWKFSPLAQLCEKITKGSSPKWQGINYVEEAGILFVTSENVGEYRLLLNHPKYVESKFNDKEKKSILKRGDVLTNIVGASIGRTAIYDADEVANINQAVCLIRCEPRLLYNSYLTYLLNSPVFKQILHDNEVDNARANLSLGFFSNLEIPLPPLDIQKFIVEKLDVFRYETQRLEANYQRKIALLDELKKSLLQQAFAGEL